MLILHSVMTDSGGEYHRLSDLNRFGCIPVMEQLSSIPGVMPSTVDTLSNCAGIVFAKFDDIPSAIINELQRINSTPHDTLRQQQISIDQWWHDGIQWETLLEDIVGPHTTVAVNGGDS